MLCALVALCGRLWGLFTFSAFDIVMAVWLGLVIGAGAAGWGYAIAHLAVWVWISTRLSGWANTIIYLERESE